MVALPIGKRIHSATPVLRVTNRLVPGAHRFALEVIDAAGRRSIRDVITVVVLPAPARTVRASRTRASGRR